MPRSKKKRPGRRLLRVPPRQIMPRRAVIAKKMLGKNFFVYSGNTYISVACVPNRIGTKFGEYCFTRVKPHHLKKKKKKAGKK